MQETQRATDVAGRAGRRSGSSVLAVCAALLSGCGWGDGVISPVDEPISATVPAYADARPNLNRSAPPQATSGRQADITVTVRQRAYLNALEEAGLQPSDDLQALSIGAYVCQARAAGQSDHAVWDLVLPLVRSDVGDTDPESTAPVAAEVNAATAEYIRIASHQLC